MLICECVAVVVLLFSVSIVNYLIFSMSLMTNLAFKMPVTLYSFQSEFFGHCLCAKLHRSLTGPAFNLLLMANDVL